MTALFLGELVSLSNTADVPFGVGWEDQVRWLCVLSLLTSGGKSHLFRRTLDLWWGLEDWQILSTFGSEVTGRQPASLPVPQAGSPERGCLNMEEAEHMGVPCGQEASQ